MGNLYVPYKGRKPAAVVINGHRLVILSQDRGDLTQNLELLGGDRVKKIDVGTTAEEQETLLYNFAQKLDGGIVIAPPEATLSTVLLNLEAQLPWIQ